MSGSKRVQRIWFQALASFVAHPTPRNRHFQFFTKKQNKIRDLYTMRSIEKKSGMKKTESREGREGRKREERGRERREGRKGEERGREGRDGRKRRRWHPTSEEVIDRLRDDGDFDSLRLSLTRKLKDNDELRNSIVEEVKQSLVLNDELSEKTKIRDLSDALFQELGGKIMGKISDEVWHTITSSEQDIKDTVQAVYNRMLNPEIAKKGTSNSALGKGQSCINQEKEPDEPPGFALPTNNKEIENSKCNAENGVAPPGFGSGGDGNELANVPGEDDMDAPPGFS